MRRAVFLLILSGLAPSPCFASLECPEGARLVTHRGGEYCVVTDEGGADRYHGPFVSKEAAGVYVMGRKEGVWKEWDASGALIREVEYRDGEPAGSAAGAASIPPSLMPRPAVDATAENLSLADLKADWSELEEYIKANPPPPDPCEAVASEYQHWMAENADAVNDPDAQDEVKRLRRPLDTCHQTPDYEQFVQESEAYEQALKAHLKMPGDDE